VASRALVFDFGTRKIGVAAANRIAGTATPLPTLPARDGAPEWRGIETLIREWQPEVLVIGLPRNADGSDSAMTERARGFARWLSGQSGLACEEIDERFTSTEAEAVLREERRSGARVRRVRPEDIDRMAALLMAETWARE
jgi:putative Holliday junction resolvase